LIVDSLFGACLKFGFSAVLTTVGKSDFFLLKILEQRMKLLDKLFSRKSAAAERVGAVDVSSLPAVTTSVVDGWRAQQLYAEIDSLVQPKNCGNNFMELFRTVPEVFWPIDYIAKRISEGHYDLKRVKDDSIVWCDRRNLSLILQQPNPVMTWRELVYQHFVNKLVTGNAFMRAAMPETITDSALICQWCENYWELPSDLVTVEAVEYSYGVPVFGIAAKEELIKGYTLGIGEYQNLLIPHFQIWHDRDGEPGIMKGPGFMKAKSRLMSVLKPISNLIAVYEARNVIYVKRGGLGFIVSNKSDQTGTVALEPDEKKELREEIDRNYGVTGGKMPYGVTDVPISFVRTNLSISELQPFEETLEDAIKIAGVFSIPADLVPRKDKSTYANQIGAQKDVYTSVIIPMAKQFCRDVSRFLGLEEKGIYIDCNFDDVDCLQTGLKELEEVRTLRFTRCMSQFNAGLLTLDDVRAQMHESQLAEEIPLFGKLKFQMTPEELDTVNKIINNSINSKPSTGEDDGNDEESSVRNEGD
jgi:hypothetical protein